MARQAVRREHIPHPGHSTSERQVVPEILNEALDNMPYGVVMFDAEARILVCNLPYVRMYDLSDSIVGPGLSLWELIEHRKITGLFSGDVGQYCEEILNTIARGKTASSYITTTDGRTIHVVNQPIRSGGWVVTHEDVTMQKAAEAQIEHLAHHDVLTDLPNRATFSARLKQELLIGARNRQFAILFIDLDNFKSINDTLGHAIGDELLREVADRLRHCIRETDMIARLGGDEFVILQTLIAGPADAANLANRIRAAIVQPFDLTGHHIVIDTSMGIALAPSDGDSAEQLLKNADMALYGAKAAGRGTFRYFEREMDARMMERRRLELDLRQALVKGEFEVHYQPLINLERSQISCCEALLRWTHATRGAVEPASFIGLAEEIGLIGRIGEWVIRTACHDAAKWPDNVSVAVNVSPAQFRKHNLVSVVANALATSGLDPSRLEIEITESILIDNTEETLKILNQLRKLGVSIAMDDFGTGYSSLSYLQKFPFNKIKIDRSFISELSNRNETNAIVQAVTSLAKTFKMTTTAEGVETTQQRDIAKRLGCTEMQGYLYSPARPASDIAAMIAAAVSKPKRQKASRVQ